MRHRYFWLILSMICACSARPPVAPSFVVKGVSATGLTSYCVKQEGEISTLWLKGLGRTLMIPLQEGNLRPKKIYPVALPQFTTSQSSIHPLSTKPSTSKEECSAWTDLPKRGVMSWSIGSEHFKVGRWGWMSGYENRTWPRALSVMSLDAHLPILWIGGADGVWLWSLKGRGSPIPLALPTKLKMPIRSLTRDGSGVWIQGEDGEAIAVTLDQFNQIATLKRVAGPLKLPQSDPNLRVPLGGKLLKFSLGGVQLHWQEQTLLSPPIHDLALLDPQHVAIATSVGVSIYQASATGTFRAPLQQVAELNLNASVTAILAHQGILYILSPSLGLLWAEF